MSGLRNGLSAEMASKSCGTQSCLVCGNREFIETDWPAAIYAQIGGIGIGPYANVPMYRSFGPRDGNSCCAGGTTTSVYYTTNQLNGIDNGDPIEASETCCFTISLTIQCVQLIMVQGEDGLYRPEYGPFCLASLGVTWTGGDSFSITHSLTNSEWSCCPISVNEISISGTNTPACLQAIPFPVGGGSLAVTISEDASGSGPGPEDCVYGCCIGALPTVLYASVVSNCPTFKHRVGMTLTSPIVIELFSIGSNTWVGRHYPNAEDCSFFYEFVFLINPIRITSETTDCPVIISVRQNALSECFNDSATVQFDDCFPVEFTSVWAATCSLDCCDIGDTFSITVSG